MENKILTIRALPEEKENVLLPMLSLAPNMVLGGSMALYMMNIMELDDGRLHRSDFDMSLTKRFSEDKFISLMDFFNLKIIPGSSRYGGESDDFIKDYDTHDDHKMKPIKHFLKKELIQLRNNDVPNNNSIKLDIFNKKLSEYNIVHIKYPGGIDMKLVHPSVILSYKSKYAYDLRVSSHYKHLEDIKSINLDKYFKINRAINIETTVIDNYIFKNKNVYKPYMTQQRELPDLPF